MWEKKHLFLTIVFLSYGSHSGREGADETLFCNLACFVILCVFLICLPFNNSLEDLKNSFIRGSYPKSSKEGKNPGRGGVNGEIIIGLRKELAPNQPIYACYLEPWAPKNKPVSNLGRARKLVEF